MRIDVQSRRPVLKPNFGGLSGPAVLPIAVRMVYQVAQAVSIPVVGLGGIAKWQDAVQMMLAGAAAFQVGSALFVDPYTPQKILNGLETYLSDHGVAEVTELTGAVKPW